MSSTQAGLEGVVVAETELSDVDGDRGQLIVRGYEIEDLVGRVSFDDVCALLWSGQLPEAPNGTAGAPGSPEPAAPPSNCFRRSETP